MWLTMALVTVLLTLLVVLSSAQSYTSATCGNVNECDQVWAIHAAYDCRDGKCVCHPDAVFNTITMDCDCRPGFLRNWRECLPARGPGLCLSPCTENQRCLSNNTCACGENYVNVSGDCVEANTHLNQSCRYNSTCQKRLGGYSVCEGGKCACSRDGVVANSTCYKKIGLDERCTFKEQCVLVENSACTLDVCLCLQGFVQYQVQNTNSCIPVVDTHRGPCNISNQCNQGKLGSGATCITQQCRCQNEYFYSSSNAKCLYKKVLDEECNPENGSGCYLEQDGDNQHIECKKGVCQCTKYFHPSFDRKACEAGASQVQLSALTFLLLFVAYIAK